MKRGWPRRLHRITVVASMYVLLAVPGVQAQSAAPVKTLLPAPGSPRPITQLIVKFRDGGAAGSSDSKTTMSVDRIAALSKSAGDKLEYKRPMALGAHVLALSRATTRDGARAIAQRLMAGDPTIEYAVPDEIKRPLYRPNDPYFQGLIQLARGARQGQWNLMAPTDSYTYVAPDTTASTAIAPLGGANLITAWDTTRGDGIVIGVVDTGIVSHAEVNGGLVSGAPSTSGYDFVKDTDTAGDGDGRDADPGDPGDFTTAGQCAPGDAAEDSSWHGTFIAGLLTATTDNAIGIAAVAPNARVLVARALGRCGGLTSDIVDAMTWAAGLPVPNVPANAHPARVVNLSLGGTIAANDKPDACSAPEQAAVSALRAANVVVVAATGNDGATIIASPGNCTGVIAVTGHSVEGDNAYYANVGNSGTTPVTNTTTISAPGGGCGNQSYDGSQPSGSTCLATGISGANQYVISTINKGTTTPVTTNGDTYAGYAGTSMATPHVAGIAALLLSNNPTLPPDTVAELMTTTARPFPANTYCQRVAMPGQPNPCGAGMVDASAAMTELLARKPLVTVSDAQTVTGGKTATVSGTGSVTANTHVTPTTALSYSWTQASGPAVTLEGATAATATFSAPKDGGTVVLVLTVKDGNGYEQSASTTVTVQAAPASGGGGGGAIEALGLVLLALAGLALRRNRALSRQPWA